MQKVNYFKSSIIYNSFFILLVFIFLFYRLRVSYFLDRMRFLLSVLRILIGIFIIITGKIYELNYYFSSIRLYLFISMILVIHFSFLFGSFLLFYFIFEFSVIPIFLYIIIWGNSFDKIKASFFLFFYTYFSSLIFFVFLISFYYRVKSMRFSFIQVLLFFDNFRVRLFRVLLMVVVFLVKMPVFLFHVWLPLAHVESPLIGSILLARLILKLGRYGIVRLVEIFFLIFREVNLYLIFLGLWGSIIAGLICISQFDLKKIVAFSSVSHMTMMLGSIFSLFYIGKLGRIMIIVGHGFTSSAIFLGLGVLYYRYFSRNFFVIGRVRLVIPLFSLWWFIFCIINMSFPPFLGFIRELIMFSSFIFIRKFFLIMGIFLFMVSTFYTVMLIVYVISGLENKIEYSEELTISENLILYSHSFYLFIRLFFYWMF